jgi:hypothetical protein
VERRGNSRLSGPRLWDRRVERWREHYLFLDERGRRGAAIPASGGSAAWLEGTGTATWHPSVARENGQIVAQEILRSSGLYRLASEGEPHTGRGHRYER